jgi:hypothetical protein
MAGPVCSWVLSWCAAAVATVQSYHWAPLSQVCNLLALHVPFRADQALRLCAAMCSLSPARHFGVLVPGPLYVGTPHMDAITNHLATQSGLAECRHDVQVGTRSLLLHSLQSVCSICQLHTPCMWGLPTAALITRCMLKAMTVSAQSQPCLRPQLCMHSSGDGTEGCALPWPFSARQCTNHICST